MIFQKPVSQLANPSWLFLCFCAISLAACTSTSKPPAAASNAVPKHRELKNRAKSSTAASSTPPTHLEVRIGGFFGKTFEVRLENSELVYKVFENITLLRKTERIHPTAEQWQAFNAAVTRLDVRRWRSQYNSEMADGTQWSVKLGYGGKEIATWGNNAFPGIRNPRTVVSIGDGPHRLSAFNQAVSDLLGGREFE